MNSSLEVYNSDGDIIFERDGKWLHPLFGLIEHIAESEIYVTDCILHDKIIGAAAAVLIIKMGFKKCHGELMSRKAIELFDRNKVEYSYGELVDKILCKTEKMIGSYNAIGVSYDLLANIYRNIKDAKI